VSGERDEPDRKAVSIRRGTTADAGALAAFAARTFEETYRGLIDPDDIADYVSANYSPALQRAELEDPGVVTLLANAGADLVAFAQLRAGPPPACVIDPAWQGRGLAANLMNAVREAAAAGGARSIWLSVWEKNPKAIRFYEKHGFRDVGAAPFTVGSDVQNDRIMVARLEPGPG
jgi:ribosomal protein S18 acetylase RimI-like enzyme